MLSLFGYKGRTVAVFILGSQRSGTTMVADLLDKSPDCDVFLGNRRHLVFEGASRLIGLDRLQQLIDASRKRIAVFKPNNDLQCAGRFLAFQPDARLLWIYRDYRDAINSSVNRWGAAHRDIMLGIARGRLLHPGQPAIAEGITDSLLAQLQELSRNGLSVEEGAALLWYARNSLYFDLHLDVQERVMLLNYEDLVRHPLIQCRRIFEFVGARFRPGYADGVFATSIGRQPQPVLRAEIKSRCDEMLMRLNADHNPPAVDTNLSRAACR